MKQFSVPSQRCFNARSPFSWLLNFWLSSICSSSSAHGSKPEAQRPRAINFPHSLSSLSSVYHQGFLGKQVQTDTRKASQKNPKQVHRTTVYDSVPWLLVELITYWNLAITVQIEEVVPTQQPVKTGMGVVKVTLSGMKEVWIFAPELLIWTPHLGGRGRRLTAPRCSWNHLWICSAVCVEKQSSWNMETSWGDSVWNWAWNMASSFSATIQPCKSIIKDVMTAWDAPL